MKRARSLRSLPFDMSLRDALGERLRVLPDDCARYAIAGRVPMSVALPRDAKEAALALAAASAEGAVVAIRGGGTKSHRPPRPRSIDVVVDTSAICGIVEHAFEDLTVTVGGGTSLAELESALSAKGQFWPCDAPFAQSATVGGTLAANAGGPVRLRYGPLREQVLGIRIATPDGVLVRAGARVVKSVAGYDAHKLMVGSFGTLGLIVEATLKTAPLPETEGLVVARFRSPVTACAIGRAVGGSALFPLGVALLDEHAARRIAPLFVHASHGSWLLLVRCGGNRRSLTRQFADVIAGCAAAGADATAALDRQATARAWAGVRESFGGDAYPSERYMIMKIASLPTETAAVIADATARWPTAEISAQPASGLVFVHVPAHGPADAAQARPDAADLAHDFARAGWTASVLSSPDHDADSPPVVPPFVAASSLPTRLLRAVKASLDPEGTLDPGRLPGGV